MRSLIVGLTLAFVLPKSVFADGFDSSGEQQKLVGQTVVDAGNVERLDSPVGITSRDSILKLNARCLQPLGYWGIWSYGQRAGLLSVDRANTANLTIFEVTAGTIKTQTKPVIVVRCP